MAYKTIYGTTSNQYVESAIDWDYTSDPATNTSTVTAKLYYRRTNTGYTTSGTGSFSITINGTTRSSTGVKLDISNTWVLAMTATVTVPHNPDGTKTITISATGSLPPSSLTETYCSDMVTLDTIPRASAIGYAASVTLGNACDVRWTPLSASFRYRLKFTIGSWVGWSDIIHPNKTSSYTYTGYAIPIDVANQVYTKTGIMTVTLYTYSDSGASSQIGSADSETFTVTVPDNDATKPTISMILSPVSNLSSPFNSMYIQGKSKVKANLYFSFKYGADPIQYYVSVDNTIYGQPYEVDLTRDGVIPVTGFIKDTRGHYNTANDHITVIPYAKPFLQAASGESNIVATRCDKDGKVTDSGTYLKIKAKIGYEKVIDNGVQYNFGKIQYRYRAEGGLWSDWYTILDTESSTATEISTGALLNGALSIQTNYQVQVKAIDNLDESQPITLSVPSENVYMDRPAGGNSMGLGGYSSGPGNLDVYWKTKARGGLSLFNKEGEEISADETLPLPRGELTDGWNPNSIANGVHVVENSDYPLKDAMGNTLMENGVLIQMAATVDESVLIQMALPTDTNTPVYRIRWYGLWTDWNSL